MKRRAATVLIALAAAVVPIGSASAATTHVVDDDGTATAANCDATTGTVPTKLQEAIDAAATMAGDRIVVCPGTYAETVKVTKSLTIEGPSAIKGAKGPAVVQSNLTDPASATGGVHLLANNITWSGFTVSDNHLGPGMYTSPSASGYDIRNNRFEDNTYGLYLHAGGATPALTRVRDNLFVDNNTRGPAGGNGIYSDQGAQNIAITGNRFEGHRNSAIVFANAGTVQRDLVISRNRGEDNRGFLALYNSTGVLVEANTVANDTQMAGNGIRVGNGNDGVVVRRNDIDSATSNGIAVTDHTTDGFGTAAPKNVDVIDNKIDDAGVNGIAVTANGAAQYEVRGNSVEDSGGDGIYFGPATSGNTITRNKSADNGDNDCRDDSNAMTTTGPANTWTDNKGRDAMPRGICRR